MVSEELIFLIGMIYAFKQGYIGTQNSSQKHNHRLRWFLFFFLLQSLQYAPMNEQPQVTYSGDGNQQTGGMLGTNLDYSLCLDIF